ncbi:coiled-coil domain-containing protein 14 isoform X4 [Hypanus sabinus]|uniref:coiled-coil domain-containing protein 14 isoform X4 n=1 Tax=Hypanus sabinus TaxID=79690 RepID=UPI0028C41EC4|nr:coiled-coil domain-containing protein 14 isoform X4 [Hypanus sabinus]
MCPLSKWRSNTSFSIQVASTLIYFSFWKYIFLFYPPPSLFYSSLWSITTSPYLPISSPWFPPPFLSPMVHSPILSDSFFSSPLPFHLSHPSFLLLLHPPDITYHFLACLPPHLSHHFILASSPILSRPDEPKHRFIIHFHRCYLTCRVSPAFYLCYSGFPASAESSVFIIMFSSVQIIVRPKSVPLVSGKTSVRKVKLKSGKEVNKKDVKKNGSVSCVPRVLKEVVSASIFKVTPDTAEVNANSGGHLSTIQEFRIPSGQHSPLVDQCLSDNVETQMAFLNGHGPVNVSNQVPATPCNTSLDSGPHTAPTFNRRLTTSTPAISPKNPARPLLVQHNISSDPCNQPASHKGLNFLPVYPVSATVTPTVSTYPLSHHSDGRHISDSQGPQQWKEQEQLMCIQCCNTQREQQAKETHHVTCKAQMQAADNNNSETEPTDWNTVEDAHSNLLDVEPVKDTIGQNYFAKQAKPKKQSPDKTAKKIKTVRYLLSELKALVADQDDSEVFRLIMELEDSISLLPTVIGSTNIQAEIAMSLQPLRSENAQLRRRLRIVNQQLREREKAEKDSRSTDCNFEVISLQSMNTTLHTQLRESLKELELLQRKNEELLNVISSQREQNKQLLRQMQGKEQDLFQSRQQCEMDTTRVKMEVDEALTKMRKIQLNLEASEKENQILEITLHQRDAEVSRLRELTRTLQGSMERLLSDLSMDFVKPTSRLTRSHLQEYEKHLQDDPCLSSVAAYLKNLSTNSVQDTPALSLPYKALESEQCSTPLQPNLTAVAARISPNNGLSGKSSPSSFSIYRAQTECHNIKYEDSNLDETTYIPLVSNASKQGNEPVRKECIPVQSHIRSNMLHNDGGGSCNGLVIKPCHEELEKPEMVIAEEMSIPANLKEKTIPRRCSSDLGASKNNHIQTRPLDNIIGLSKSNVDSCTTPALRSGPQLQDDTVSAVDSSFSSIDYRYKKSNCSMSSFSSFNSWDEQNFRNSLAALDANIARLQKSLQADIEIH